MDYEKRKKNYFDKLKNIGLPAIQNDNDFGISVSLFSKIYLQDRCTKKNRRD